MNEFEKIIFVSTNGKVDTYCLSDDEKKNSAMLKNICDQMRNGSSVAFGQRYYEPYRLFDLVCSVVNKLPDLIDLDKVYKHVIQYKEWVEEASRKELNELIEKLEGKF